MPKQKGFSLPKNLDYTKALQRLQVIVQELQNGETNIDELGDKVEEAAALVSFCKAKLRETHERVEGLLEDDRP